MLKLFQIKTQKGDFFMNIVTPKQMKTLEFTSDKNGNSYEDLMLSAGKCLYNEIVHHASNIHSRILFLCGNGNNAGDCFVASTLLHDNHYDNVCIAMLCGEPKTELSKKMFNNVPNTIDILCDINEIKSKFIDANILCDGIFGTGFHGELPTDIQELLSTPTDALKIAIDIPSGIDCKTGKVSNGTMSADLTLTFAYKKLGMILYPARKYCGNIYIADIGITKDYYNQSIDVPIKELSKNDVKLPPRLEIGNKGTFGKLLHITGSQNMLGACIMASKSALRSGVGLLTICTENHDMLPLAMPEPIYINRNYDNILKELQKTSAILIGCGLGTEKKSVELFKYVIENAQSPIIIDADGINILSKCIDIITNKNVILTPHPMEFSRLTGLSLENVKNNKLDLAIEFSQKYQCTLILKGSGDTIITDGNSVYICNVTNSGMAKGGSGDVLAGIVSSFVAQGMTSMEACKLAVYIHTQSGLLCADKLGKYSMLPTDIIGEISNVIKTLE